jgi:hypothetical protein
VEKHLSDSEKERFVFSPNDNMRHKKGKKQKDGGNYHNGVFSETKLQSCAKSLQENLKFP